MRVYACAWDSIHPGLIEPLLSNEFTMSWKKADQAWWSEAIDKMRVIDPWFQWQILYRCRPKTNLAFCIRVLSHVFIWPLWRFLQPCGLIDSWMKSSGYWHTAWPNQQRHPMRRARQKEEILHHALTAELEMNCC